MEFVLPLFLLILAAVCGGIIARVLKISPLVGYIVGGIVFGTILPPQVKNVARLSEIGTILLLFSIGLELSLTRLSRFIKIAVFGSLAQIVLVSLILFFFLQSLGFEPLTAFVLATGFSLSSTAIVVKVLGDRGELDTIHGGISFGWLLVQDLAVIPIMVVLPVLGQIGESGLFLSIAFSLAKALGIILGAILLGKMIVPYLIHKIAEVNSRELLTISSVGLALGTAVGTSLLGVSPSLGAFLAGVVISEGQEHHAIFAETRPLRDLFVALFFVSLGFLITPSVVAGNLGIIFLLAAAVVVLKIVITFLITTAFGFKGRTAVANAFGLGQVGEFSFVIYSAALALGLLTRDNVTIGIGVTLVTLIVSPLLFRAILPVWRKLKKFKIFSPGEKCFFDNESLENHIIICGYGRVGSWVGKALENFNIPFVVIEYDRGIVSELREKGIPVLYGDPGEVEILNSVNVQAAKVLVLAIPDMIAQENLITYAQTLAPQVRIISRVHRGSDWEKFKTLRVNKIVQPEFEAAMAITRSILSSMGKDKVQIADIVKKIRISHAKS